MMRFKRLILLAFAAFLCVNISACSTAGTDLAETPTETLSQSENENLVKLCKVWGYVKYRHPAYLLGIRGWDADLMELIPQVQKAKDEEEVNRLLHQWFTDLGEVEYGMPVSGRSFQPGATQVVGADTAWTKDAACLGEDLAADLALFPEKLPDLERSLAPVYFDPLGTPNFSNEIDFAPDYEDAAFRLTALFRLWNAVEYYYPYLDLLDRNWEDCLSEAIPVMLNADDRETYENALMYLAGQLKDPHIGLLDAATGMNIAYEEQGRYRLPAAVTAAENKLVVDSIRQEDCPLEIGDVLVAVNGRSVEELAREYQKFFSLSRDELLLSTTQALITRSPVQEMEISVLRDGKTLTLTVQGVDGSSGSTSKPPYEILDGNIGLINPAFIESTDMVYEAMEALRETEGLILDMRQYPGSPSDFFNIMHYLIRASAPSIIVSYPYAAVPGVYTKVPINYYGYGPAAPEPYYFYDQPVAVLIDCNSISASEYVATMLDTGENISLVGSNTVGTDGNVALLPLPGGLYLTFTSLGCYEIDGSQSQQVGIDPDIEAPYTIQGIKEGRDEPLEAAVDWILSAKST